MVPKSDDIEMRLISGIADNGKSDVSSSGSSGTNLSERSYSFESSKVNRPKSVFHKLLDAILSVYKGSEKPSDNPPSFGNNIFRALEEFPRKLSFLLPNKLKILVIVCFSLAWVLTLRSILFPYLSAPPFYRDSESGQSEKIITLSCGHESLFWRGENDACGLNAKKCGSRDTGPLSKSPIAIRCPAFCDYSSRTFASLPVGNQTVKYRSYYIGGGKVEKDPHYLTLPYRADSFPCAAAIHAGLISPETGGCAFLEFTGPQYYFNPTSGRNTMPESIGFDSFFPESFRFVKHPGTCIRCKDPRILAESINIVFGFLAIYFLDGLTGFWMVCISHFWTVLLSFDPPLLVDPARLDSIPELLSLGFRRFLPLCFMLFAVWKGACNITLTEPTSQVCKAFIWYPLFCVGMLNNVTFDRLPLDRLTPSDIREMPGSMTVCIILLVITITCVIIQAFQLWKAGRIGGCICGYTLLIIIISYLSRIPGLEFRLHHYVIGLILIPGTRTKGITAFIFQGLLLGLAVNGVTRWGFSSIEETNLSLLRGDSAGRMAPPSFLGYTASNSSITWYSPLTEENPLYEETENGKSAKPRGEDDWFSLLVNDIEVYHGPDLSVNLESLSDTNKQFGKLLNASLSETRGSDQDINLYLRVARISAGSHKRSSYTRSALLKYPGGEFHHESKGST